MKEDWFCAQNKHGTLLPETSARRKIDVLRRHLNYIRVADYMTTKQLREHWIARYPGHEVVRITVRKVRVSKKPRRTTA